MHTNPAGAVLTIGAIERSSSFLTGNAFIQNLQPSDYLVQIARKGYQPWTKTIHVEPQTVTELYPILMPITPVTTVLKTASSTLIQSSPESSLLIFHQTAKKMHTYEVFDTNLNRSIPFADTLSQNSMASIPDDAEWHWTNESHALIDTPSNWYTLEHNNGGIRVRSLYLNTALQNALAKKPRFMAAHPAHPSHYFLLDDTNFVRWNPESHSMEQLLQSIGGIAVGDSHLILWDLQSGMPHRTTLDATQAQPYASTSLPLITSDTLQELNNNLLVTDKYGIWLLPNTGKQPIQLTNNPQMYHTTHTDAYVLWWNAKSISMYWIVPELQLPSFQKTHLETIYASGGTIQQVLPYPNEHYLLMQEDNTIYAFELDGRGGTRNKHLLYKGENPVFHAPPHEKIIYVYDDGTLFTIDLP
ncbi:MAG: hypothetical protein G01um101470_219 [Parcubacteria group bacterium Gr01-1014_70]|nr:MAG: hypothetical protein G01um101470_219 [Parcubacteria group bacterium Gr01-1014_70]